MGMCRGKEISNAEEAAEAFFFFFLMVGATEYGDMNGLFFSFSFNLLGLVSALIC